MQPRSRPLGCSLSVTNAPDFVSNALGISTVRFARLTTYASRASRAMRTASSPSRSAYDIRLDNKARALTLSARFSDCHSARPLSLRRLACLACELDSQPLSAPTSHSPRHSMRARVPVVEIMTQSPVTIPATATAKEAAGPMRDREIGSLVVVETGKPMGIVTERDIVTKVAAPDKQPSRVLVRDIMTSPVVVVHPHEEVAEAAKLMSQRKIRRLPVVQEGKLVGMITENDIIRVWPQLIEVTREYARAGLESQFAKGIEGHCEACGVYSTNLVWDRNLLVCPECRGGGSGPRRGRAGNSRGTLIGRFPGRAALCPLPQGVSARN